MKKHKLYLTDAGGGFSGHDLLSVFINELTSTLKVGRNLSIPLREIMAVELRPLPENPDNLFLAIDVCGPSLENGSPTTLALIHKNFFANTKVEKMQALVDELAPLVRNNKPVQAIPTLREGTTTGSLLRAHHTLNVSILIGYYRKTWNAYDAPGRLLLKTLFLMAVGGIGNCFGILAFRVPLDNWRMSQNLLLAGWKQQGRMAAYILTSFIPFAVWLFIFLRSGD